MTTMGMIMNRAKAILCLTALASALIVQGCGKEATPPATKPVAPAAVASGTGTQAAGEDPYKKACAACHDQGVAGAPKLGDRAAWAPRIKQGKDALYTVGLKGKPGTGMMARGGNAGLSDADVTAAVDYMVSKVQ